MDMTWREFILRRHRYLEVKRQEDIVQRKHTRLIAYTTLVSTGAIDTKKMSIDKFMPIDEVKKGKASIEEWQKEALMEAINGAVNESRGRTGGTS